MSAQVISLCIPVSRDNQLCWILSSGMWCQKFQKILLPLSSA